MFRCHRATAVETMMLGINGNFPDFEELFQDVFGPSVKEIIIADPYLYTDIQQFCVYRWLCVIKNSCRIGRVSLDKLTITFVTKNSDNLYYKTEFQAHPQDKFRDVLTRIFNSVGFDDQVQFRFLMQHTLHDRSISILSDSDISYGSFTHVKLGRGLAMVTCRCQGSACGGHSILTTMGTDHLKTLQCEVSKLRWSSATVPNVDKLFTAYKTYISRGIITGLSKFNN